MVKGGDRMKMTKAERMEELDVVKMLAEEAFKNACMKQKHFPLGHGFLWAYATIDGHSHKFLIGGIDGRENWSEIERDVKASVPEITHTYINVD